MSFSISGIFKPAKQTESLTKVTPKTDKTKILETDKTAIKQENGSSCCGGCGGGKH
ncbi:hypothetical protein [Shewanella sp. OMA3-2]|uniref:hypothetical protein n=1 Tax=Shewanella sp. OMA3-2 TaxID=2908650 RepID=UPI001F1B7FAF|nr:hypothetical protein [Shewanella sp. OMA3-2]UJF20399.1 hypothetical protein L0B17_09155 [Shewanella sp. OMA3-2]